MTNRYTPQGAGLSLPISRRSFIRASTILAAGGIVYLRQGLPAYAQENFEELRKLYDPAKIDWQQAKGSNIVLGGLDHPWMNAIVPLIPVFEQLTGIKVAVEKQSETEYTAEMPIKLAAGSATPDVYMVWSLGQAISAKWLEPLDSYEANPALHDAEWYDAEDVFGSARSFQKWSDGESYGHAITAEAQTLFMNKTMMAAANVAAPATMDDLLAGAMAMKTDMAAGIVMRAKPTGDANPWTAGGFIFSYGGAIVTLDGKSGLQMPETIAAVEMYGKMLREAGPLGIASYHWMECLNDFMQGAAAIGCDSSNFASDISNPEKSTVVDAATFGALPGGNGAVPKPNMWHWMAGINANSANKDAAYLFLMWATSKPTSTLAAAAGLATTRASAWESSAFKDRFGADAATAALSNLSAADGDLFKAAWFHPRSGEILDPLAIAINDVITGTRDAAAALKDADAKVTKVLAA